MSTSATITWSDIQDIKSKIDVINSKLNNLVAVYRKTGVQSSAKTVNDLSFALIETTATIKKGKTKGEILTPAIPNSATGLNTVTPYFIAISDVKSSPKDDLITFSSALYSTIKSADALSTVGTKIGEVASSTPVLADTTLIVDILFIAINP
jgi:hypothetical protein